MLYLHVDLHMIVSSLFSLFLLCDACPPWKGSAHVPCILCGIAGWQVLQRLPLPPPPPLKHDSSPSSVMMVIILTMMMMMNTNTSLLNDASHCHACSKHDSEHRQQHQTTNFIQLLLLLLLHGSMVIMYRTVVHLLVPCHAYLLVCAQSRFTILPSYDHRL